MPSSSNMLTGLSYLVALMGPTAWAMGCWFWAVRTRRWKLHVMFLPGFLLILWLSLRGWIVAMGYDVADDSELGAGAAFPLVPVVIFAGLALLTYLGAVVTQMAMWLCSRHLSNRV